MAFTTVADRLVCAGTHPSDRRRPSHATTRQLGLSWLHELHALAFADGDANELLDLIKTMATALAADGDAVRDRLLARHTALAAASIDLLVAAAGAHAKAGDETRAILADRLATAATRRLVMLLRAAERHTVAIAIQNAIVSVESEP